ncbi:2855_t:CDS:2, partial [Funneliformis geosporum]
MIREYKNVLVLDLYKDFHSFNRNTCKEDQWLGLSLVTVYYGGKKTSLSAFIQTIICKYGEESLMAFDDVTEDAVIVPILSGIFGKKSIIGSRYSAKILSTPPLSFDILEQSPFKLRILISDIGGVARLL